MDDPEVDRTTRPANPNETSGSSGISQEKLAEIAGRPIPPCLSLRPITVVVAAKINYGRSPEWIGRDRRCFKQTRKRPMKQLTRDMVLFACLMSTVSQLGCGGPKQSATSDRSASSAASESADAKPAGKDKRLATAVTAKDALFKALSGRLMEVMQAEGPVAAISVCSQEALQIAETVGKEHGVEIGRTSFKLRNPANAPRDWVQPFVDERADTTQQVQLENGNLGALFPIQLNVKCLMCHGGPDDMLDDVKPELAKRYPQDEATGFKQGDLRGWFWVEVPPEQNSNAAAIVDRAIH